ncbi:ATP-CITRATE SYNTHASE [Salix purpurea]|uniref:ATP-CITRATE SYNTHASE n=1 Tax=Salix purpurea TaxID=77065 RepID=A0A9Q0WB53_SALPP|nr:ATP-CITRATE SYNTHASE [Salix purpurea]
MVGDLGYASELGNYAEYSGAPNEEEVLQYARIVIDCATADPDGRKRALLIEGGIANFTDVAATFNGIIRALREKESKLKAPLSEEEVVETITVNSFGAL